MMASPTENESFSDVKKVGYLRKPKSMHKRFFVLRGATEAGPARLEYYENEKKWRHKSGAPKRSFPLENCFNINKRADAKNKYLVAMYTKDEYFAVATDNEAEQESWYLALLDLHNRAKVHDSLGAECDNNYGDVNPGPAFKEVWQVILKPKGLGQSKNLVGIYRLCLTSKTISFVKLNSDVAAVVLQLMNIRRCGHSENFFFVEVGRSAVTGPGEFWMQVDDSVVAQNMHETILEAMKAMSDEFRPRSKSQPSSNCSNPISVPLRRHHLNNPPPSQVGLGRRSRTESVTATSPAGPCKQNFRVRASSDGEGTMSRPASVDGSPVSPTASRTLTHRQRGSSRLHPPLNHSRSIPMPSSRCSPSATSPVSLSSSSTSGHGSTSDCLFPRRSSASVSGSPSDGGFISSDEYGSSPCDFRNSFRSVTPDSLGHTPPAREDLNNYISMNKLSQVPNGHCNRVNRCASSRGEEADVEKGFRKRTHSAGNSPPTISHQKTPSQSSTASLEEYTEMLPSYPCRLSYRQSAFVPTHSYPEECLERQIDNRTAHADDGYMPMSPGVAPVPSKNDYVPMSPKSVSAPQQIINPRPHSRVDSNGYMMMSPSGSCSPENTNYGKMWANTTNPKLSVESNDGKLCSDYINMSPASGSTTSTPPDCYFNPVDESAKPIYSYFSLPRSFKHVQRKNYEGQLDVSVSSGHLTCGEDSSSSTSSDSLGGQETSHQVVNLRKLDSCKQLKGRLTRPTRLSLDNNKANTLPRTREHPLPPEPKSPGEYVNIEFNDEAFSSATVSLCSPSYGKIHPIQERAGVSEYMNMDFGAREFKPSSPLKSLTDSTGSTAGCTISACKTNGGHPNCDYVSMQYSSTCLNFSASPVMINYTENTTVSNPSPQRSYSPNHEMLPLANISDATSAPLMGQVSGMSAFTRVNLSPSRSQGAKVIRADPQGRRRHSSETFSASSMTLAYVDDVKRHSSASFENVWLKQGESATSGRKEQQSVGAVSLTGASAAFEGGLNYIDLDLVNECNDLVCVPLQPKAPSLPCGRNSTDDSSAYASISFQKPEDFQRYPAKREE
ncbi:insulin receptor substrate 1 isoform X2 [Protopterus annectens]|uniref:insulin receptor substrate 1 isoform X2 n=1 Tax=Protopterus annectens TaxID=7888 RepID=UPI001CFC4100|nr:insulin receptor substrate 1 isoform X2 [Protopterus annectens]